MPINCRLRQHRQKSPCISSRWMSCIPLSGEKNRWYLITLVDRASSCIVGSLVSQKRDEATMQKLIDQSPRAHRYYSDLLASYKKVVYSPGKHTPMPNKSETYRVEGVNAELRHYLSRLHRRSRCFSRCVEALKRSVKLFTYAWNRRQLYRQQYPNYDAHLFEFLYQ